ncbi:hypothetical protein BDR05DRAFT_967265 [Suillus weaverae]|nr:hypothetical protein BDR05DRAFT_967265 [Suillus weaverae]
MLYFSCADIGTIGNDKSMTRISRILNVSLGPTLLVIKLKDELQQIPVSHPPTEDIVASRPLNIRALSDPDSRSCSLHCGSGRFNANHHPKTIPPDWHAATLRRAFCF